MSVVVLAACGGGSSSESDDDLLNPMASPLVKLLGWDMGSADSKAKQLEAEQKVAECMKAEGWEYTPRDYSAGGAWEADLEERLADPVAYGEKYGYGVVRGNDMSEEMSEEYMGIEDPNADYVNSLSADESMAYYEALNGDPSLFETMEGEEPVSVPLAEQGCYGQAQAAVYGEIFSNPDIFEKLGEMEEDVMNDPVLVAANEKWAACMADIDPSYEWATPEDIYAELYGELSTAQGYTMTDDGEGGMMTEPTMDDAGNYVEPEVDEEAIEALRVKEVALWGHDFGCQQEADLLQVRRDVEQRMADELLEAFPELGEG